MGWGLGSRVGGLGRGVGGLYMIDDRKGCNSLSFVFGYISMPERCGEYPVSDGRQARAVEWV
jgi:hypothetical protein